MILVFGAIVLGLIIASAVLFATQSTRHQSLRANTVTALQETYEASTEALRAQLATGSAIRDELEHQNRALDAKLAELTRRLANTQRVIETLGKERDFWHGWYHQDVADHGAAQHLLLNEFELHVKRGCQIPFSPQMRVIVRHYDEKHPTQADQSAPPKTETEVGAETSGNAP